MLASCSVCASLFANYTAVVATFLAFRYSCLVPPFLHCCHDFRFSFTALSTSLLQHQIISSHLKFIFYIFPSALHFCRNLLTFYWHSLFKFPLHYIIFQLSSFHSSWNTDGFDRFCWYNRITDSNLCCVMHSSLLITFIPLMFFSCALLTRMKSIYVWLPPDEKVISLLFSCERKCW